MRTYTMSELNEALEAHRKWLEDKPGGVMADLSGADLSRADLSGANLSWADLSGADLSGADLSGANLSGANLSWADLSGADLSGANLSGADLSGADLSGANLSGADLSGADLSGADLSGAYHLDEAKGLYLPTTCPEEGAFIGWKKCKGSKIVKLLIPAGAQRSSASGRKCRASEAVVLAIFSDSGKPCDMAYSGHDQDFIYRVGETVMPTEPFDTNRWKECAPGIHFFITRGEAERYVL